MAAPNERSKDRRELRRDTHVNGSATRQSAADGRQSHPACSARDRVDQCLDDTQSAGITRDLQLLERRLVPPAEKPHDAATAIARDAIIRDLEARRGVDPRGE